MVSNVVQLVSQSKSMREKWWKRFADERKKGRVVFRVVDISTSEGEKIAKDYRVTWSSLYINGWKKAKKLVMT